MYTLTETGAFYKAVSYGENLLLNIVIGPMFFDGTRKVQVTHLKSKLTMYCKRTCFHAAKYLRIREW